MLPPSANVLIVSGLKREAAILAGPGRATLCGDRPALQAKLAAAAALRPSLVVSWGVCGGLDPALRPGDLILGAEVVSGGCTIRTDERITSSLAQGLADLGRRVAVERLADAAQPVMTAAAKSELRRSTGAAGVDMESLTAGEFAAARGIPFAILRAVADPAGRSLPPLAAKGVRPDGRIDGVAVIGGLLRSPGQIAGLGAAALDAQAAFRALTRCRRLLLRLFPGLVGADL